MDWVETALKRAGKTLRTDDSGNVAEARTSGAAVLAVRHLDRFPKEAGSRPRVAASEAAAATTTAQPPPVVKATSPRTDPGTVNVFFSAALAEKLVVMRETRPVVVEQFRKLAATLHEIQRGRTLKVVMVASAVSGEGKTFCAMNLALTLSESFRESVLLIDADLRRPQMHEHFGVPGLNGLALSDDQPLEVVQITPTLQLLPAERPDPDPMRVLTSDRIRRVVADAGGRFDWVILDSPPVADLPDAHLLAGLVDGAVVIAAAGRTPFTAIARAVDTIGRDRVVGIVLNHVEEAAMSATRELAYSYLGASSHDDDDSREPER